MFNWTRQTFLVKDCSILFGWLSGWVRQWNKDFSGVIWLFDIVNDDMLGNTRLCMYDIIHLLYIWRVYNIRPLIILAISSLGMHGNATLMIHSFSLSLSFNLWWVSNTSINIIAMSLGFFFGRLGLVGSYYQKLIHSFLGWQF